MIGYFDTSSFVSMLIREDGADKCRSLGASSATIVTSRVTYVEPHAAVSAADCATRIDAVQARAALRRLDDMWRDVDVIELALRSRKVLRRVPVNTRCAVSMRSIVRVR